MLMSLIKESDQDGDLAILDMLSSPLRLCLRVLPCSEILRCYVRGTFKSEVVRGLQRLLGAIRGPAPTLVFQGDPSRA